MSDLLRDANRLYMEEGIGTALLRPVAYDCTALDSLAALHPSRCQTSGRVKRILLGRVELHTWFH